MVAVFRILHRNGQFLTCPLILPKAIVSFAEDPRSLTLLPRERTLGYSNRFFGIP